MENTSVSRSAFINLRVLVLLALFTGNIAAVLIAATVHKQSRLGDTNPVGFRVGPAMAKSTAMKTSPEAPSASAQWVWQRPLPQGNPLYAASFADPNHQIAVGEDATILRTTDGGAHWTIKTSRYEGAGVELFGVSFSDASIGTAVGSNFFFSGGGNAVVLRTTDGGNTWVTKYNDPTPGILLFGASFPNANTGTVIGIDFNLGAALILRTTDGGETWANQDGPPALYQGISFSDANNGTIVGVGGIIIRTTDGGNNWVQQNSGIANGDLYSVSFTDANNGTAVGADFDSSTGIILRTTDGGTTWGNQYHGTDLAFQGVSFTDGKTGTAVGSGGAVARTTDGGNTWSEQSSGTQTLLQGVAFRDAKNGTAVSLTAEIIGTTDGGATWEFQTTPGPNNDNFRAVSFTESLT